MVMLIALVITGFFVLVALAMLIEVARRLFWFAARLAASAAVALVGGVCVLAVAAPEAAWMAAPAALALAISTLWASRGWGGSQVDVATPSSVRLVDPADYRVAPAQAAERARLAAAEEGSAATPTASRASAKSAHPASPPILNAPLNERLATTEAALARAARDDIGQPAADWLTFWRRRVPDLIASAQDVWDDAGSDRERADIAQRLTTQLHDILSEADRRLSTVRAARRDLFATRANHAAARVREG